ncbi:glutathione S-transferase [Amylibacter marinus]|uniref:Glutathione S-transferase n=1 Tax=Amylibacter marinus TaxID=1475483 RepID=A0ABQ5VVD6_9RHOB|nr:glutathione S-transferase family protein [Amylibacter marinus]GLQ35401.1 glutathione S-transferase [Amylibacter marinus]
MYTIVGELRSRSLRVLWTALEMDLEFEHVSAPPQSEAVRRVNPSGKIPALVADGHLITDSVAIMTYLADRHHQLGFAAGTIERAQMDSVIQLINDEVDAVLWAYSRHKFVLPKEKRVAEVLPVLEWELQRGFQSVLGRLGDGPYLMGEKFTIADILLTHLGGWARTYGFTLPAELQSYCKTQIQRPAYKEMFRRAAELEAK